ncbi:hypothetical protein BJ508DRAFT_314907 [Ascobolus immersus RN42]|uniref:Folliculin-interacting protein N-terminal domain-containing protein n=1 Tax=Ascobolus immersus RN42 TaxID=1160509 RepID=A0A3N4HD76_ASCIM|nr:hypothetical protein BJ508DRAFT_314907 [Ascobolus immersus RN42]
MLTRFFASSSHSTPPHTRPPTSHHDDTIGLLYPDTSSACSYGASGVGGTPYGSSTSYGTPASASTHDLDANRDIRILIAQDGASPEARTILFDSNPPTPTPHTSSPPSHQPAQTSPLSPSLGAFCKPKRRTPHSGSGPLGPSSNAPSTRPPTNAETAELELRQITEMMFGSVKLSYSGPSTKVHVLPSFHSGDRQRERRDPFTTQTRARGASTASTSSAYSTASVREERREGRKWVLVTRMFAIAAPAPAVEPTSRFEKRHGSMPSSPPESRGYPFPSLSASSLTASIPRKSQLGKSSMFAIGLLIALPPTTASAPPRPVRRCSVCWEMREEGCRCDDPDFPSGLSSLFASEGEEVDLGLVTKHWPLLSRSLTSLQTSITKSILEAWTLGALTVSGPNFFDSTTTTTRCFPGASIGKVRRRIELRPGALMFDEHVRREVESFFLTLLTAFLGTHTKWLDVVAPQQCRNAHKKTEAPVDDEALRTRTVITGNDPQAIRRLIYLLSSLLPSQTHPVFPRPDSQLPRLPPSRSSSILVLSQSPPAMGGLSKRSSVRSTTGRDRKKPSKLSVVQNEEHKTVGWDIPQKKDTDRENLTAPSSLQLPSSFRSHRHSAASSMAGTVKVGNGRPSSSGSSASLTLSQTLKKTTTAGSGSSDGGVSMWGSLLSSIWSNPRSSASTVATSEASAAGSIDIPRPRVRLEDDDEDYNDLCSPPPRRAAPGYLLESPVSVEVVDGEVEVGIPFLNTPGFMATDPVTSSIAASFFPFQGGSPASYSSSPTQHRCYSRHSHTHDGEGGEREGGLTLNALPLAPGSEQDDSTDRVAPFLEEDTFHPDFCLQGLRSYPQLDEDVRRAMRDEPTPEGKKGGEVLVATTLVADAESGLITRYRLYRSVKEGSATDVFEEAEDEERWVVEPVMDLDATLAAAVEGLGDEREEGVESVVLGALREVVGRVDLGARPAVLAEADAGRGVRHEERREGGGFQLRMPPARRGAREGSDETIRA